MKKTFIASLVILFTVNIYAQNYNGFEKGYLITNDSNKIECYIKYISDGAITTKPLVKNFGERKTYLASEIKGYVIGDNIYTVLKDVEVKYQSLIASVQTVDHIFAKQELEGTINLYSTVLRSLASSGFGFNFKKVYIIEKLPDFPAIQLRNSNKKQLSKLRDITKDKPDIYNTISDKKLSDSEIIDLIRQYNKMTL